MIKIRLLLPVLLLISCRKDDQTNTDFMVMAGNGDITARIDSFRLLLGSNLNTVPGALGGRREITWEAIPDEMINKTLPFNFFNQTAPGSLAGNQRGLVYSPDGDFRVSKSNFSEVSESAAAEFSSFSGNRTFANLSANQWDVEFQLAGQAVPATVSGFGMVFSDVDNERSTSMEFFDGTESLGTFFVPVHNNISSLSFLGVYFKDKNVSSVRVRHDGFLGAGGKDISNGGEHDLVIMDDILYSEPVKK